MIRHLWGGLQVLLLIAGLVAVMAGIALGFVWLGQHLPTWGLIAVAVLAVWLLIAALHAIIDP